jgi:hypothetical protein
MFDLSQSSFSGHETFAFRFGWLPKGVRAVEKNAAVFAEDQAMVTLGVGKNMVKSIRHWCIAARLVEAIDDSPRAQSLRLTELGRVLLSEEEGQDRYLEDPGSLWLLHWLICTSINKATTWRWAFGYWSQTEFTREGMVEELLSLVGRKGGSRANRQSLDRDAETFLHTYVAPHATKGSVIEDTLDCPLVELRLLRRDDLTGRFEFVRGAKPSLPNTVLGFAILDYWERLAASQESVSFETLLYGEESPGRIFRLSETAFTERIESIAMWSRGTLVYDDTAGMRQIYRKHRGPELKYTMLFPKRTAKKAA